MALPVPVRENRGILKCLLVVAFRDWLKDEDRFRVEAAEMANGIESKPVEYVTFVMDSITVCGFVSSSTKKGRRPLADR